MHVLSKLFQTLKTRKFSYRIVFVPETIGSIAYLSKNMKIMKKNIIAGYNLSCVGDDRSISFLPSRKEDSISDRVALQVLNKNFPKYLNVGLIVNYKNNYFDLFKKIKFIEKKLGRIKTKKNDPRVINVDIDDLKVKAEK